jgi:hypothetical protein
MSPQILNATLTSVVPRVRLDSLSTHLYIHIGQSMYGTVAGTSASGGSGSSGGGGGASTAGAAVASATNAAKIYSPAVSRSAELVSCAQTAVKIAQSRHAKQQQQQQQQQQQNGESTTSNQEQWFSRINPADLRLYDSTLTLQQSQSQSSALSLCDDGLTLLHTMAQELQHLEGLVRRRGHSNDPTAEISASIRALERDAAELSMVIPTLLPVSQPMKRDSQRYAHYQALQAWFQTAASRQAARLKEILAVRGTVLAQQAQRRQRFVHTNTATNTNTTNNSTTATAAAANALFALPPPKPKLPPPPKPPVAAKGTLPTTTLTTNDNGHPATTSAAAPAPALQRAGYGGQRVSSYPTSSSSLYASGNGSTSYNDYQASYQASADDSNLYASSGMRQRKTDPGHTPNTSNNNGYPQQQLVQQYQEQRVSAQRLKEAVQAEKSLAALGTVFGKMSTLLQTQSETLTKIEDDVEAAQLDVHAGQEQISILYAIKKGNRPLILKVYALLIFLILFMRFYVQK